jgi:acetyl esterase
MPLDPIVASMLAQMAEANAPAISDLSPAEGRAMYRMMNEENTLAEMASVKDDVANGVPVRIYRPVENKILPCLVFFHGGGWVIGDLETHDNVCRALAHQVGCVVVAVDYRLAPEHRFPAALDDSYNATCWVADNAAALGIDPSRIAVGGDSAGGNLATCVCLQAKTLGKPALAHQLLVYPVTDTGCDSPSYTDNAEGYMLTRATMAWFWDHYIGDQPRDNPLMAPLLASDVSGLPSATVITAEFDPLRDEGEAYAAKLTAAGVVTSARRYDGMIHGFVHMQDALPDGRDALSWAAAELTAAFNK